jgi:diguanylate cyclase (GGDEF)-like protein/PAS domain S-box-containing protein
MLPAEAASGGAAVSYRVHWRSHRLAYTYSLGGLLLSAVYFAFPNEHMLLWAPLGLSAVVATVVGVRRYRPTHPVAWYLLAAGLLCFISGDTIYNVLTDVLHQDDPFPSVADLFYLAMYPFVVGGLLVLVRARTTSRDRASIIDALTMATGMGLLSWVYLIAPYLEATELTWLARTTSIAYPVADIVVLATLARLCATGLRIRSLQFLVLGSIGLLVADVCYGWVQLNGVWVVGGPVDAGWVVCYLGFGTAALHPSMREVTRPVQSTQRRLRGWQIALLGAVSLIAPGVLALEAGANRGSHPLVVAVFSAALYLLVIARLAGIVAVHQQSVARERALRRYGESLVSARTADEVHAATMSAVMTLATGAKLDGVSLVVSTDAGLERVAVSGRAHPDDHDMWSTAERGGDFVDDGLVSVISLRYDHETRGMLVARFCRPVPAEIHFALSAIGAHAALALEGLRLSAETRRQQQDARFKALIQNASDLLIVVTGDGTITYSSPSVERRLGRPLDALTGSSVFALLAPVSVEGARRQITGLTRRSSGARLVSDWTLTHTDGEGIAFEVVVQNLLEDLNVAGVVLTMRDVSERRELERRLSHQAFHDALTGLANRSLFHDRAQHALERVQRQGGRLAMLMLDLDDFKLINDTLGHAAGDEFLVAVAGHLAKNTPSGATVARLGGDEFATLLEDVPDAAAAKRVAESLVRGLDRPFIIQDADVRAGASCGFVIVDKEARISSVQELLRNADLALYEAKERGRSVVVGYHDGLQVKMREKVSRKSDLRRAVEAREFSLRYQPIIEMGNGRIVGAEALVRWEHPKRGLVGPNEFIPAAEESGMIIDLGRWILEEACRQALDWPGSGSTQLRISVNVSPLQIQHARFSRDVEAILGAHPSLRHALILEITETTLMHDGPAVPEQMHALHHMGALIAIDDFGVGYSSLGYLQRFPIDILKIDKSFVDNLGSEADNGGVLAHAVVSMAHALRLQAVAEGIEQISQHNDLRQLGCDFGQGYLYSRPLPPAQFAALLADPFLPARSGGEPGVPQPSAPAVPRQVGSRAPLPSHPPDLGAGEEPRAEPKLTDLEIRS